MYRLDGWLLIGLGLVIVMLVMLNLEARASCETTLTEAVCIKAFE